MMGNINKKKLYIGASIVIGMIILFIGGVCLDINGDKIIRNTYVNNIDISGLTKEEAEEKISEKYKIESISLSYLENEWSIELKELDISYDISKTIDNAYNLNRENSLVENLEITIKSYFGERHNLEIIIDYDEEKLKEQIEEISKEIDVEVEDAKINITGSDITIEDEKEGLKVDIEESLKNIIADIEEGNTESELVVNEIAPTIKRVDIEVIDTVLGTYTTKFDASTSGRTENIRLATNRTSGVLLMPGDIFSYNEHTGVRSYANGYKNAPVIVQGVVQEGVGGGVCQVSTTLYNAVLYAGLEIVNVRNHSIPSTYAPKGQDATVVNGAIDFVFKNNLEHPVYIRNYVSGNTVTCQIYGSSQDKQNITISTNIDGVSVAPVKRVEDPTLLEGEEKELESGRNGYTVSTYRIYKDNNGNTIRTEKIATSYYPKKQGIIAVGTKVEEIPPEEIPPEEQPPEENPPEEQPPEEDLPEEQPPEEIQPA